MALVIRPEHRDHFPRVLAEMYRLRRNAFVERLKWPLPGDDGVREIDQFDTGACLQLAVLAKDGRVVASSRLTPSTEPNLTCDVLQVQINRPLPRGAHIVEISRLCADEDQPEDVRVAALKDLRRSYFGLFRQYGWTHVLAVAYAGIIDPWIRAGGQVGVFGSPVVFPGDREPWFAVLMSGVDDDGTVERYVGPTAGALLDPAEDPSLIDLYGQPPAGAT